MAKIAIDANLFSYARELKIVICPIQANKAVWAKESSLRVSKS